MGKHPSHNTRFSDASTYDEICVNCGATDRVPGGWGELAAVCPNPEGKPQKSFLPSHAGILAPKPKGVRIKPCLLDMDGTIADHTGVLMRDLAKIQSPNDPPIHRHDPDEPEWVKARKKLIRSQRDWWLNLPQIDLGMEIYRAARAIGFQINILTKGPWTCDHAWTEKVQWVRRNLDDDVKITISEDKSIIYGRILVDDYIPYVLGWINNRPRGLVIMVANEENENLEVGVSEYCSALPEEYGQMLKDAFNRSYKAGLIVRYDGKNYQTVYDKMKVAYERE